MSALDDLRVLDLSGEVAGPFCARLFADFGADVIRIDPLPKDEGGRMKDEGSPDDHDSSFHPPSFKLFLNANKRNIVLNITTVRGVAVLRRLVATADIVIESFAPGFLGGLGLDFEELERIRPGIILASITPFGQTGPWRDLPANDLIVAACSGWASINGSPNREPLKPSGYQASFQAGLAAFDATMAALLARDGIRSTAAVPSSEGAEGPRDAVRMAMSDARDTEAQPPSAGAPERIGRGPHGFPKSKQAGQHVDISLLEPSLASFAPALLGTQYRGEPLGRQHGDFQRGPVPAADGYFSLTLSRAHFWRDAMYELGLPELAEDARWYEASYRQEHHGEVAELVQSRIAARGKRELFDALGALRVVAGMVLDVDELYTDPHVQARGFFVQPEGEEDGPLYPGAPFRMSRTPWALHKPAPRLGEHTVEILTEAGFSQREVEQLRVDGVIAGTS